MRRNTELNFYQLTGFQRDIIRVISRHQLDGTRPSGATIQEDVGEKWNEEINHGRMYPNLDQLALAVEGDDAEKLAWDTAWIDKRERDRRTKQYSLTDAAIEELARIQDEDDADLGDPSEYTSTHATA